MKKTLFIFILLISIVFNSCKKDADFSDIDPNLPGKWYTLSGNNRSGSTSEFSVDSYMNFYDWADNSSIEDDVHREGEAKIKEGIIILGESRFEIQEYPIPHIDTVRFDIQNIPTTWRMKMRRAGNYGIGNKWNETITYYKE